MILALSPSGSWASQSEEAGHTRSILACDSDEDACGIASVSYLTVPGFVPLADSGVVVANQGFPHHATARSILTLVKSGEPVGTALATALSTSPYPNRQQLAVVALDPGQPTGVARAAHTGSRLPRDCEVIGDTFVAVANTQTTPKMCNLMAELFVSTQGRLATRLLAALVGTSPEDGDVRGETSAALVVYSESWRFAALTPVSAIANVNRSRSWETDLHWDLVANLATDTPADPRDEILLTRTRAQRIQRILKDLRFYDGAVNGEWSIEAESSLVHFCINNVFFVRRTALREDEERYLDSVLIDYITLGYPRGILVDATGGRFGS
ncbi:MAG: DUF1028 domain-containing protein [Myxococcota bacterium]